MVITLILFAVLYLIDQLTKHFAVVGLVNEGASKVLIPNFLTARLVYNKGAAWGVGSGATLVLAGISLIASIVIGYYILKNDWKNEKFRSIALTLAFSGCVGNLFDRVWAGFNLPGREGVVDMIDFEPLNAIARLFNQGGFPIFNMADAYLVIGLILFAIDFIFLAERREKNGQLKNK